MIAVPASHSTALDTGSTTGVGLAVGAGMLVTMASSGILRPLHLVGRRDGEVSDSPTTSVTGSQWRDRAGLTPASSRHHAAETLRHLPIKSSHHRRYARLPEDVQVAHSARFGS